MRDVKAQHNTMFSTAFLGYPWFCLAWPKARLTFWEGSCHPSPRPRNRRRRPSPLTLTPNVGHREPECGSPRHDLLRSELLSEFETSGSRLGSPPPVSVARPARSERLETREAGQLARARLERWFGGEGQRVERTAASIGTLC